MMQVFIPLMRRFMRRENGAVSVEFAVLVPLVMTVFLATFENGITMMRKSILDFALESTVRELRLGMIASPTPALLKTRICERVVMIEDCAQNLTIELNVRNTATGFTMPSTTGRCINSVTRVEPVLLFQPGAANDLVLVRVCLVQNIIFPFTTAAMRVADKKSDSTNYEYQLISTTAFVNEPR
jgi:Flp pilus assembly pilin Flp